MQRDPLNLVGIVRNRLAGAVSEAPVTDPLDQIRKLAELRDAGLVTPQEYEQKKIELLARV